MFRLRNQSCCPLLLKDKEDIIKMYKYIKLQNLK